MKKYQVTYVTKYNRREHHHSMTVEAENSKEARKVFDREYYRGIDKYPGYDYPHPFRINISLIRSSEGGDA